MKIFKKVLNTEFASSPQSVKALSEDTACRDSMSSVEETLSLCGLTGFFREYVPVFLAGKNV